MHVCGRMKLDVYVENAKTRVDKQFVQARYVIGVCPLRENIK